MTDAVLYGGLKFDEAIKFLRAKVNVPTTSWTTLWQAAHARAFSVAGAVSSSLLDDFRAAIEKAQNDGTSLAEFRKDFDAIVAAHGWSYNGSPGWRSQIIYQTNLSVAHAAGRYQQMTQPDVIARRPYWMYRHGPSATPRPEHLAWDGLVLAADDPWWNTHYPPNGWGCKCSVHALNEREIARMGLSGPQKAPPINMVSQVVDGKTVSVPEGIDPGWAYNVGQAVAAGGVPVSG